MQNTQHIYVKFLSCNLILLKSEESLLAHLYYSKVNNNDDPTWQWMISTYRFLHEKFTIYTENILVCPAANMHNTCNKHTHTHIMGNKQYMNNDHTASRNNTQGQS